MKVKKSGTWRDGIPWVKKGGVWHKGIAEYVKKGGVWQKVTYSISHVVLGSPMEANEKFYRYNGATYSSKALDNFTTSEPDFHVAGVTIFARTKKGSKTDFNNGYVYVNLEFTLTPEGKAERDRLAAAFKAGKASILMANGSMTVRFDKNNATVEDHKYTFRIIPTDKNGAGRVMQSCARSGNTMQLTVDIND